MLLCGNALRELAVRNFIASRTQGTEVPTPHRRRQAGGQQAWEKMLNAMCREGNANWNSNEMPLRAPLSDQIQTLTTPRAGKDVEQQELPPAHRGGDAAWGSPRGRRWGSRLQNWV